MNPLEYKHDLASRPLKWMMREVRAEGRPPTDEEVLVMAFTGFVTAGINLFPALGLIQAGVRGDMLFSHVSYVRFNPWAKPMFHYIQAASKAELIGGAVGSAIAGLDWAGSVAAAHNPLNKKVAMQVAAKRKLWMKGGAKLGARVGGRLIPGVGWALLAYDVYDIAYNRSLWGFDF